MHSNAGLYAEKILATPRSSSVLLEFPVSVVEWTDLSCLKPARDTMKVKSVL